MGSFEDALRDDSEMRNRFLRYANSQLKIVDFPSLKQGLMEAFNTDRGNRASKFFDDNTLKFLFESEEAKSTIRQNVSEEEFNKLYGEWGEEKQQTFVVRREPTGKVAKPSDVQVFQVKARTFKVEKYQRQGRAIRGYQRSFRLWQPSEVRFIRERKREKISPKDLVWAYNKHFLDSARSPSSIKTKLFRTAK
jgi:hypothetical protein